jgi:hypothetical protein
MFGKTLQTLAGDRNRPQGLRRGRIMMMMTMKLKKYLAKCNAWVLSLPFSRKQENFTNTISNNLCPYFKTTYNHKNKPAIKGV